mgnify:CR=1 FL=1
MQTTENKGVNPSENRIQELQKMYTSFNEGEKFQQKLNETLFPHVIPDNVREVFFHARGVATPATLGGSVQSYLRLMRLEILQEITYMDAAGILNFIESLCAVESGVVHYESFLKVMEDCHNIAINLWKVDTDAWRDAIADEKGKLKEFVQAEIGKVNASIKGKKKGKHVQMHQN